MSIEELKKLQLKIIKKNRICNIIQIIAILIVLCISINILLSYNVVLQFFIMRVVFELVVCVVVFSIVKSCINGKDIELFIKTFKKIFVLSCLKKYFNNVVYLPERGFDEEFVNSIGMIDIGDRFCSNDYISGIYKNIKFEQADIHIQVKKENSDDNSTTEWQTLFLGRLMIFDFNKKFKANIQVSNSFFDAESLPWSKKFSEVRMEDVEFNENFCVYAQDEHEAFYVLTPHFMEKLKKIEEKINCGIMFCFIDNKLYVAIDNYEDSFEWDVFKIIDEQQIEERIIKDIKVITEFVDELNLDNDLFRKKV